MPRLQDVLANFCERRALSGAPRALVQPDNFQPAFPNAAVPLGSKHGFRVLPRGLAFPTDTVAGKVVRVAGMLSNCRSQGASPGYPVWVELSGGRVVPVTGPEWQRIATEAITIRPFGDALMKAAAGAGEHAYWTARYTVETADTAAELGAESALHRWPSVKELVPMGYWEGGADAAPVNYADGMPVHPHYTNARIVIDTPDTIQRYVWYNSAWFDGGQVSDGTTSQLVWEEFFPTGGGVGYAAAAAAVDSPGAIYYKTGNVNTVLSVLMGYSL